MTWTKPQTWVGERPRRYRSNEIGFTALLTQLLGGWTLPLIGRRWLTRGELLHAAQLNAYVRENLASFRMATMTVTAGEDLKRGDLVSLDVNGLAHRYRVLEIWPVSLHGEVVRLTARNPMTFELGSDDARIEWTLGGPVSKPGPYLVSER